MERKSFKEYPEIVIKKRRALTDKILLRGTSCIFINVGRCFFFGSQNRRSGVLKNFQAAEGVYDKIIYIFRWELMLISILIDFIFVFSLVLEKYLQNVLKLSRIDILNFAMCSASFAREDCSSIR